MHNGQINFTNDFKMWHALFLFSIFAFSQKKKKKINKKKIVDNQFKSIRIGAKRYFGGLVSD